MIVCHWRHEFGRCRTMRPAVPIFSYRRGRNPVGMDLFLRLFSAAQELTPPSRSCFACLGAISPRRRPEKTPLAHPHTPSLISPSRPAEGDQGDLTDGDEEDPAGSSTVTVDFAGIFEYLQTPKSLIRYTIFEIIAFAQGLSQQWRISLFSARTEPKPPRSTFRP